MMSGGGVCGIIAWKPCSEGAWPVKKPNKTMDSMQYYKYRQFFMLIKPGCNDKG
jgi:hypothetical protein